MEAFRYALLGIVQGLTEFLPVSSSGHLAIAHRIVGIEAELGFDLAVHMGTALAVIIYYFKDFLVYAADIFSTTARKNGRRKDWDSVGGMKLVLLLVITSIPAALAGFLLEDKVEAAFSNPWAVSAFLVVTGIILLLVSRKKGGGVSKPVDMSPASALTIGIAQAFALFPGISRSGMTISSGLASGLSAGWAVDYSMMASLPVIIGAFLIKVIDGSIGHVCGGRRRHKPYNGASCDFRLEEPRQEEGPGRIRGVGVHRGGGEYRSLYGLRNLIGEV